MKTSVTGFSVPIEASVFKFCVYLQVGNVYCVNENKDAKSHFAFFFQMFLPSLLYNTYGRFLSVFSASNEILCTLSGIV